MVRRPAQAAATGEHPVEDIVRRGTGHRDRGQDPRPHPTRPGPGEDALDARAERIIPTVDPHPGRDAATTNHAADVSDGLRPNPTMPLRAPRAEGCAASHQRDGARVALRQ